MPVITLELLRLMPNGRRDTELAARIRADGDNISIEGPEPELVDVNQPVMNLRDGTMITCAHDPEEWVRGPLRSRFGRRTCRRWSSTTRIRFQTSRFQRRK